MRALAIIPARGGSKGIPGKNIRLLGGKPLLAYTVEAAMASRIFDRIMVTTDSQEIAVVARDLGVDVPFMRPEELAGDTTPTLPVLQHATRFMIQRDGAFEVVCTLQATTPFRHLPSLRAGFAMLEKDPSADSAVAVSRIPAHLSPDYAMKIDGGLLLPFLEGGQKITRRQDARAAYTRNGEFYFTRVKTLLEGNSIYGSRCLPVVVPEKHSVNLDTRDDWEMAELLLERGLGSARFE
jgi:CMP-N,N'-diacetyllegionaminic acid synthase